MSRAWRQNDLPCIVVEDSRRPAAPRHGTHRRGTSGHVGTAIFWRCPTELLMHPFIVPAARTSKHLSGRIWDRSRSTL